MARGCRPGPPRAPPRGPGAAGIRLPPRRRLLRRARARGPGPGAGAGAGGGARREPPARALVRPGLRRPRGAARARRRRSRSSCQPTDSARRARGRYSAPAGPRAECGRARANWGPERRARAAFQQQVASRVWGAESGRRGRAGGGLSAWGRCPRALGGSLRRVRGTLEVAAWPGRLHSNGPGPVAARIPAGGRRGATQPVGAPAVAAVSLAPPPAFFPGEALAAQAPVRARQGRAPVTRERRL